MRCAPFFGAIIRFFPFQFCWSKKRKNFFLVFFMLIKLNTYLLRSIYNNHFSEQKKNFLLWKPLTSSQVEASSESKIIHSLAFSDRHFLLNSPRNVGKIGRNRTFQTDRFIYIWHIDGLVSLCFWFLNFFAILKRTIKSLKIALLNH